MTDFVEDQHKTWNIAIAFDQNYLNQFHALLTSILLNNKKNNIYFHLIAVGLTKEEFDAIDRVIQNYHCSVFFYDIDLAKTNGLVMAGEWTNAVYFRLFFPLIIPATIERLLYLDTDTIVLNDLSEFFDLDLENYPVGAVYDNYVKTQPLIGLEKEGEYFNSGVLLVDTQKWREQKISERTFDYIKQFPERIRFVDQCGLNAVLKDNWKKLENRFNLLYTYVPQETGIVELKNFLMDKVIVHFTLHRPWTMLCKSRLRYLYFYYLKRSGRKSKTYSDFRINKIPAFIKLRMIEMYFDIPFMRSVWKTLKRVF